MDTTNQEIPQVKAEVTGDISSLLKKLCSIMGELESIPKNGYNEFHNYHYLKESDVTDAIRKLLAKHKVFVFPEILKEEYREMKGRDGKTSFITRVEMRYSFMCADTCQTRSVKWVGYGHDSMEKGLYKALAGAHKYVLMKSFHVSQDDDPENERGGGRQQDRRQQQQRPPQQNRQAPPRNNPAPPPQNVKPEKTDQQKAIEWFIIEADKLGYREGDQRELIGRIFPNIKSRTQLQRNQVKELIEIMRKNPQRRPVAPAEPSTDFNQDDNPEGPFPFEGQP